MNDDDDVGDDRDVWGIDMSCIDWARRWKQNKSLEVVELNLDGKRTWNCYEVD